MKTAFDIAKHHVDTLPPAISGAHGHNATFRAACWLVKCGLGDADAMPLLRDYNRRCQPPWTEKELRHKLVDASRRVVERLNFTPAAPPPVRLVWKVEKTIQPRPDITPPLTAAPPEASPGNPEKPCKPWITKERGLVIPFGSPAQYHWWQEGQTVTDTRAELRTAKEQSTDT